MGKQNNKLIKNMKIHEQKTQTKQQESKVLVKEQTRRTKNKKESINVYSSSQRESLWSMVRKRLKLWNYQKQR